MNLQYGFQVIFFQFMLLQSTAVAEERAYKGAGVPKNVSVEPVALMELKGYFALDWIHDPSHEKCQKIEGPFFEKLRQTFVCQKSQSAAKGSIVQIICTMEKNDSREYIVFPSEQECERHRIAQAESGD